MSDKQLEVLQTVVAMFNAAPGARYLNEFVLFLDNTGSSVKELASFLAQTDVFKQSLYSDTLSNTEFADQFVNNTAGLLVSKEDKAWAASEIVKMLDAGESRGDVLYWAATALASIDFTNIHWGATAQQFNHKIEVAAFYSIDQSGSATSLSVLQQVTEKVTNDISTVTAIKTLLASNNAGKVIDGYVKKALVFADLNGDHLLNPEEASSITDAFGNFFLPSIIGFGDLIASGGIDIATGMPFEGIMTAPAGATVITPLTTLVDKIVQDNAISVQSAVIKVLASLDLNTSIDLLHFDPIKEAIRTDIYPTEINNALKIHVASVQIQILVSQIAALLHGAGIAPDETTAIDWAYDTLAAMVGNSTDRIPLTSKSIIVKVIVGAAQLSGVDEAVLLKSAGLLADASQSIANLNLSIINTSQNSGNKLKILANIAAVQIVSENIEADMESGAAKGNVASTVRSTTGALFTNAITKAGSKVGDVNGDGKSDAHLLLPSSGGGSPAPSTNIFYLATNATAFSGTAANDILSISTASTWTPLIMTAVVLNGGAGINTISVQDGSSIALATVLNFTNLIFDATGVVGANNVTMSAAQHQNFTGTITALGTGVNGEQITISGDGNITTLTDIETYVLEDDSTNARTVTVT
ncbi:calcium-binding protein, partial [Nitrosomonas supralitoralis]